ncbi:MAG: DNA helicase RecQ [Polyangiaceae bacterium]
MLDAAPPPATSPETPTFEADSLPRALERTFGFASFRPYQEEIIRDALAGRDVLAVLPTGGGKSLCFQLPAVLRQGLTLVVSPLIALMKDQVDSLTAAGIPATFLSSTLEADESRARLKNLRRGEYRLLYVAPERLLLPGFLASLSAMDIRLLAVDEAHCISQWGHDFRPEYRRIADLRDLFPKAPVMALSATATERVRADITASLRLVEPRSYIASFDRPNILYRVEPKESAFEKLLALLASHEGESGILYAHSRKSVEALAARLRREHINAAPYHAGMDPESRAATQEAFARDDIRIICATVAFGMGIHKPDVRFVVHHDLPGDIESYYQETGRAGRDGLPSEALLFWNPADALKQRHFIDQKPDLDDRAGARRRLAEMLSFAESGACRRRSLLAYFGEHRDDTPCNACDNCLSPREQYDATIDAQKLLSCVLRIQQRSHLSVGLTHIIAVLLGADTEKIRRLGHTDLSTYGIGADKPRAEWSAIARELLRQGLLRVTGEKYAVIEVTPEGLTTLKTRTPVTLTRPLSPPRTQRRKDDLRPPAGLPLSPSITAPPPDMDTALFDALRKLRKSIADARDLPAYIIFGDLSLRQMATLRPTDLASFRRIHGVGEKRLTDLGPTFLAAIQSHIAALAEKDAESTPESSPESTADPTPDSTPPSASARSADSPPRAVDEDADTIKQEPEFPAESERLFTVANDNRAPTPAPSPAARPGPASFRPHPPPCNLPARPSASLVL